MNVEDGIQSASTQLEGLRSVYSLSNFNDRNWRCGKKSEEADLEAVIQAVILKVDLTLLAKAYASVLTTTASTVIIVKAVIKSYLARMKLMFCIWGC